jgi:hypothetical protein
MVNFLSATIYPGKCLFLLYNFNHLEHFQEAIADMELNRVRYVVQDSQLSNKTFAKKGFPGYQPVKPDQLLMENYLNEKYQVINVFGQYQLLERKPQ